MMRRLQLLIALLLILQSAIAQAQPPAPLTVDASAQGRVLTIAVFASVPATLRITLPAGWSGAPQTARTSGIAVLVYQLDPGDSVGLGEVLVQAWSGGVYASDRAWVWGRTAEAPRAVFVRRRYLPVVRR